MRSPAAKLWTQAQAALKQLLGRRAYKLWFVEVRPLRMRGESITLEVPTDFHAAYIREHYLKTAEIVLSIEQARELKIRFVVTEAQRRMPAQLTYFHQRLAYLRVVARKEGCRLTNNAKRFLVDTFHRSASALDHALFILSVSSCAGTPLTERAVRSRIQFLIDAAQGPQFPLWLAPK